MGSCFGRPDPKLGHRLTSVSPTGSRQRGGGSYTGAPVDRSVLATAAEKRLQQQANRGKKGEVRLPKSSEDLPELPQDGLRWRMS